MSHWWEVQNLIYDWKCLWDWSQHAGFAFLIYHVYVTITSVSFEHVNAVYMYVGIFTEFFNKNQVPTMLLFF